MWMIRSQGYWICVSNNLTKVPNLHKVIKKTSEISKIPEVFIVLGNLIQQQSKQE